MTRPDDARESSASWLRWAARGVQVLTALLVGYALVRGQYTTALNGVVALAVTFVPAVLEWRYDHRVDPRLALWIAVAAVVHLGGFLWGYGHSTGLLAWYDQIAHVISASLVAGVGYALVQALDRTSAGIRFPEVFRFVFTLYFVLAFGVAWEIIEFSAGQLGRMAGAGETLVQYGIEDIVSDLTFNTLAGAVVAVWGTEYFRGITALLSRRLRGTEDN